MLSRVADNLYWMSRYLERAEHTARIVDVHLNTLLDLAPGMVEKQRLDWLIKSLKLTDTADQITDEDDFLKQITFGAESPGSIISAIITARENARQVREQISSEMWTQLNQLYLSVHGTDADSVWVDRPHEFYVAIKEGSHLFQGITDATMNHDQGWHFIQIGRYMERITNLVTLLEVHLRATDFTQANGHRDEHYFELVALLKSVSAFEAYCKVYNPNVQSVHSAEFLLFNAEFPRSARFCVEMLQRSLDALADVTLRQKTMRLNRVAGRLRSALSYDDIDEVIENDYYAYLANIKQQTYRIHDTLFDTYITYAIDAAL